MFTVVGNDYHNTRKANNFKCRYARMQLKATCMVIYGYISQTL